MAIQQNAQEEETALPVLRDDLQLLQGAPLPDGTPGWLIFDPLRYRYFQIDRDSFELLSLWKHGTVRALAEAAQEKLGRGVGKAELEQLFRFLIGNSLTEESAQGSYKDYYAQAEAAKQSWGKWLLHHYLFFRIPLVRPQAFLAASWPVVSLLFTRTAVWFMVLLGGTGLYFASRQWDSFVHTFLHFISWEGAFYYLVSLVVVKIAHEFGHAFMAYRFGCRVPTMGVAFLLMVPLLYTDVTDAWRLKSRRQRLMVDAAGMFAELYLAAIATFAWAFLPDGTMRSIAFVMATTSWVMSLAINLNPFMKFDGYYILSDASGTPNLQDRGFAIGKWKLREILFGLGIPAPEAFSRRRELFLTVYAWGVWIYRFFLFLGIALLVYHYFFKALGLFLFAVEILWFIIVPVTKELKEWWNMKDLMKRSSRSYLTLAVVSGLVALVCVPWSGNVYIPSIVTTLKQAEIHTGEPARISKIYVKNGQRVRAGDRIIDLVSPDLEHQRTLSRRKLRLIELRLARIAGDGQERSDRLVLEEEKKSETHRLQGIEKRIRELEIRAPRAGRIRDMARGLLEGRWINPSLKIASILAPGRPDYIELRGALGERDLHRIRAGASGIFIPDDAMLPDVPVRLEKISETGMKELKDLYLASDFGGHVSVRPDEHGRMVVSNGQYLVTLQVDPQKMNGISSGLYDRILRGQVVLKGKKESFLTAASRQVIGVLIRESGV